MAQFDKLTEQQKLFAKNYIANGKVNATDAAMKSGYGEKSAHVTASRLLKNANLLEYIDTLSISIEEIFRREAKDMVINLVGIANDKKAPTASRVRASVEVLTRAGYAPSVNVAGSLQHVHSGHIEATHSKEIHIIQQLVNANDDVADAILEAMKDRTKLPAITEEVGETES